MTKAVNPFLPNFEYVPDGEPHVFGDRIYLYGSHDRFNGYAFCLNDYVCWSASVTDLANWKYEGVIYKRRQDPRGKPGLFNALYAPDVCKGPDGRYYLYYFLALHGIISVAVCDTPAGKYEYLGDVHYPDGVTIGDKGEPLQFDPGVFVDTDGKIYLYTGFGPVGTPSVFLGGHKATEHGPMAFELEPDMLTIKSGPSYIGVEGKKHGKGTPYEDHEFFEASSMRKRGDKYYFIYSTMQSHELAYAVSDNPTSGFEYGGILVSNGDVGLYKEPMNYTGNVHGSIENINGQEYVFYHRQTNRNSFSRQACAEKLKEIEGRPGYFKQAEMTSCGLNQTPLDLGKYGAYIACQLYSKKGTYTYGPLKAPKGIHPYFTQHGKDRERNPNQYIANMADGSSAVFKYFTCTAKKIGVKLSSKSKGEMHVYVDDREICAIPIDKRKGLKSEEVYESEFDVSLENSTLRFMYTGKGSVDFIEFELK